MGSWALIPASSLCWGLILILEVGNGADWLYGKLGNINFIPSLGLPKGEGNSTSLETLTNYGKFRLLLSL